MFKAPAMRRRAPKYMWRIAAVLIVGFGALFYSFRDRTSAVQYMTGIVSRGSIVRSVTATGTINPVVTVQVGTYVSGPIEQIYVDFNSPVKKGELIAKIDPRPFEVTVAGARASLASARASLLKDEADLAYKKITYERDRELIKSDAVSRDILDSARSAYAQTQAQVSLDRASVKQQQASLHAAEVNLNYTNIVSPVDGTIVSRNVDVGQTVAASFQTPTLFLIARDLTQMQVDTNVSESDIGDVRARQSAYFTVDAFPDRRFQGAVAQVRQAPITVQNVVTYDVVVDVANPEFLLKPGMTANLTIVTAERKDVVRVPVQALRFQPFPTQRRRTAADSNSAETLRMPVSREAGVWTMRDGMLKSTRIVTGLDDGSNVEMISGDLKPGDSVIVGKIQAAKHRTSPPRFPH